MIIPHILCIGDLMLDQFFYGTVDRISPEAPVPVLHIQRRYETLGGAGNVVRNLQALGSHVTFLSSTGNDSHGDKVRSLLAHIPNLKTHLATQNKTTTKTRYSAQGQQILRSDDEIVAPLAPAQEAFLLEQITAVLPTATLVLLSDYKKGLLSPTLCNHILSLAAKHKIPVIVDPKGSDYSLYNGATIITPNLKELREATGMMAVYDCDIETAARHLISAYNFDAILVTRSADGLTLIQKDVTPHHIPTTPQDVYDVSGAGDTVIATFSVALGKGLSLKEAAKLANYAAAIAVGKAGTAVVSWDEVESFLWNAPSECKILPLAALCEQVQKWQHQQLKVGFTNGCFDLLHLGHLHILKESKKKCDRLIVALNTDRSVKKLKGDSRPIHTETTRAHLIAALEIVDAVILFDESTPLDLISQLKPNVLIKGADYTIEKVAGADITLNNGGEVVLVDLLDGHSTTRTISSRMTPP